LGQSHSANDTFLDMLIEMLTGHPVQALMFLVLLFSSIFSLVSVVMALLILGVIRCAKLPALFILVPGVVLVLGAWFIDGVSVSAVHQQNPSVFIGLLHGDYRPLQQAYTWLSALPYGIVLSAY